MKWYLDSGFNHDAQRRSLKRKDHFHGKPGAAVLSEMDQILPGLASQNRRRLSSELSASASIWQIISAGMNLVSVLLFAMGGWRLLTDLGLTRAFPASSGPFANWLVWLFLGVSTAWSQRLARGAQYIWQTRFRPLGAPCRRRLQISLDYASTSRSVMGRTVRTSL
jgi:hypothetical protein